MTVETQPRFFSEKIQPRRRNVFEGVTKCIFEGTEPDTFILYFKDNHPLSSSESQPFNDLSGKGVINNRFSEMIYKRLNEINIENHFMRRINMREQLVRIAENLPFYIEIHNKACEDFCDRFGLEKYDQLPEMITELRFKNKNEKNPVVSPQHLVSFGVTDHDELDQLYATVQRINDFLIGQFTAVNLNLIRYKLEFGRIYASDNPMDSRLILIDEISLDTCRVLDITSQKRLDVYSTDLSYQAGVVGYHEIARRFGILNDQSVKSLLEIQTDESQTQKAIDSDTPTTAEVATAPIFGQAPA
ncbi:MAG: phosphoribosylaminoimidazolesuccinocarboxamide synthase [Candidatus Paracaedibacteraceae bacterium]|nr:phosphoribosylaminoimidazolesuccinocarboxamide synthase [Candidatus Paracaedibacteraceae bacterium]